VRRHRSNRMYTRFQDERQRWCYHLENSHGLKKGEFDSAERLINDCRQNGMLPFDITASDGARAADHLEELDWETDPKQRAETIVSSIKYQHLHFDPFSIWENQPYYLELFVEKIDLKGLFAPICREFHIPCTNARGWSDLHSRAAAMKRFQKWENKGKECVLLYCGDFDPIGLDISHFLDTHFDNLENAIGWDASGLKIHRFGLNHDFIIGNNLSWIDNLETSSGACPLHNKKHPHHGTFVAYEKRYGERKCEANALVVRPKEGRQLFRDAVLKYIDEEAVAEFHKRTATAQEELRLAIIMEMQNYDD
jgi:hypothetical protein